MNKNNKLCLNRSKQYDAHLQMQQAYWLRGKLILYIICISVGCAIEHIL